MPSGGSCEAQGGVSRCFAMAVISDFPAYPLPRRHPQPLSVLHGLQRNFQTWSNNSGIKPAQHISWSIKNLALFYHVCALCCIRTRLFIAALIILQNSGSLGQWKKEFARLNAPSDWPLPYHIRKMHTQHFEIKVQCIAKQRRFATLHRSPRTSRRCQQRGRPESQDFEANGDTRTSVACKQVRSQNLASGK